MPTANPRLAAYEILLRIEKERSYADILIDRALSSGAIKGPDRGLLTELVYGVLRRRGTLDHIVNQFSKQHADKLERSVLILLRLGLYQEFFLDRIPVSAAVNETVQLAHALAPRAAGFINAILRRADRERGEIRYPDLAADPVGHLSTAYSTPPWIARLWLNQLGEQEAVALAQANVLPPPLTVRVNNLKASREEVIARLAAEGITATAGRFSPLALNLSGPVQLGALATFQQGLFTIQDEASQLAVIFLDPRPGERIIDLCAAPGGKATHIAQLLENKGSILACDVSPRKLELVSQTAHRLGIDIIRTMPLRTGSPSPSGVQETFHRVLVDAPCSGLGVLRRNPEGKWWKTPEDVSRLAGAQQGIIAGAADYVEPGGTLLYSTCSTTVAENEAVVADFLSRRTDFVLEDLRERFPGYGDLFTGQGCFRSWPHRHGMDGFFAARLLRK